MGVSQSGVSQSGVSQSGVSQSGVSQSTAVLGGLSDGRVLGDERWAGGHR
jgi:hypothetical protein